MKLYKLTLCCLIPVLISACESMPQNVQTLSSTLNKGIQTFNDVFATPTNISTETKQAAKQAGMLTKSQCQSSQGKTKAQIEMMANETLTDERAAMLNSIAVTYNFEISDQVSRYGFDSRFKAICSLTLEGNKPSSKVLNWSIVG